MDKIDAQEEAWKYIRGDGKVFCPRPLHCQNREAKITELEARLERVRAIPKKSMGPYQIEYEDGWIDGWNDCLDDVQKALEEVK